MTTVQIVLMVPLALGVGVVNIYWFLGMCALFDRGMPFSFYRGSLLKLLGDVVAATDDPVEREKCRKLIRGIKLSWNITIGLGVAWFISCIVAL